MMIIEVLTEFVDDSGTTNDVDTTDSDDGSEIRLPMGEEADELERQRAAEDPKRRILADADRRDEKATARDAVSDERERVADKEAFTAPEGTYAGHGDRRAAAQDRLHSKRDRESSADDRARLTEDEPADSTLPGNPA
jgi:hypothetical protein